ncbi:MAG: hypothetical protein KAI79_02335, partial [Bacteroidales bacterium]|nr:hypothetical protein [Bacteroidales bacterium]
MSIIDRIRASDTNQMQNYCYVIEIKFKTQSGKYKRLYTIGTSIDRPEKHLIDIIKSIYIERNYIPECVIKRIRKVPLAYQLMTSLKEYLQPFKQETQGLVFINSDALYKQALQEFDQIIPYINTEDYSYQQFLPDWA